MPHPAIAALDNALAQAGQDILLRRVTGDQNKVNVDVKVRAAVRPSTPRLIETGALSQLDDHVVMSPSDIAAAQWPGGEVASEDNPIPSLPRRNDQVRIAGKWRHIDMVIPIYVENELVRIELRVLG